MCSRLDGVGARGWVSLHRALRGGCQMGTLCFQPHFCIRSPHLSGRDIPRPPCGLVVSSWALALLSLFVRDYVTIQFHLILPQFTFPGQVCGSEKADAALWSETTTWPLP